MINLNIDPSSMLKDILRAMIIGAIVGIFLYMLIGCQKDDPMTPGYGDNKVLIMEVTHGDYGYQYGYIIRSAPSNCVEKYIDGKLVKNYNVCELYSNVLYRVGEDVTGCMDTKDAIMGCECKYLEVE